MNCHHLESDIMFTIARRSPDPMFAVWYMKTIPVPGNFGGDNACNHTQTMSCSSLKLWKGIVCEQTITLLQVLIPIAAMIWMTNATESKSALQAVFDEPLFQDSVEKHVFISPNEFMFTTGKIRNFQGVSGWTVADYQKLQNSTSVVSHDQRLWRDLTLLDMPSHMGGGGWSSQAGPPPPTVHQWSYSFAFVAASPEFSFRAATRADFVNRTHVFFYHTTRAPSLCNSTQFRHAPTVENISAALLQPSSVGFGLPKDEWEKAAASSKFCLTIRGDNPNSRAIWRAVRSGCIPIVISDTLPYYAPIFRSFWKLEYFAIFVKEREFLADPAQSLNRAVQNLHGKELDVKLKALAFTQRLVMPDHPQSLFVQAFGRETIASWQDGYNTWMPSHTTILAL